MRFDPAVFFLLLLLSFPSCAGKPEIKEHGIFAPSRLEHVLGQDGVSSIEFSDDITLWTFADTILGKWKSGRKLVSSVKNDAVMETMIPNSLAWTEKISSENVQNPDFHFLKKKGRVTTFIRNRKSEDPMKHRLWALDGIRIGQKVYVYYAHVYVPDPEKLLQFRVLYTGLARWDVPREWSPGDPVRFRRLGRIFSGSAGALGAAVMKRGGYVYLAGHLKSEGLKFPLRIARVRADEIENRKSYEFLDSRGKWTAEVKDSAMLLGDVSGECSLNFNEYLKEFVVIYARVFTGEMVMVRFGDFADLPKAEKEVFFRAPVEKGKLWPYSGKEIFSEGNKIFMIYIEPEKYQPLLLEIKSLH